MHKKGYHLCHAIVKNARRLDLEPSTSERSQTDVLIIGGLVCWLAQALKSQIWLNPLRSNDIKLFCPGTGHTNLWIQLQSHIVLHNEIRSAAFDVTTCQSNLTEYGLARRPPGMAGQNVTVSHISRCVVH